MRWMLLLLFALGGCSQQQPQTTVSAEAAVTAPKVDTAAGKLYYDRLIGSAERLVGYSSDPEGTELLGWVKAQTVMVPVPHQHQLKLELVRSGEDGVPLILIDQIALQDDFWYGVMGGGEDPSVTAGRYDAVMKVIALQTTFPPDMWMASVLLHEARHARDSQEISPTYVVDSPWEAERRAYNLQLRLISGWGGKAYADWKKLARQELQEDPILGIALPPVAALTRWDLDLDAIFGPLGGSSDGRLSLVLADLLLEGKDEHAAGRDHQSTLRRPLRRQLDSVNYAAPSLAH